MAKSRSRSEALDFTEPAGRPARRGRPLKTVNLVLFRDQYEAIREIGFRERTRMSAVVRRALDEYIARERSTGGGRHGGL